jgi:hypothetical protein
MSPDPVMPVPPATVDPDPPDATGGGVVVVGTEVVAGAVPLAPVTAPPAPPEPPRPDVDAGTRCPAVVDGGVLHGLVLVGAGAPSATAPVPPGDRTTAHEMATAPTATTTSSVPNDRRNTPMVMLSYNKARC